MMDLADKVMTCSKCGTDKPADHFYGRNQWCRECKRIYAAKWTASNREAIKAKKKEWQIANRDRANAVRRARRHRNPDRALAERIRDKYRICYDQYLELLHQSGGACAICRLPGENLHIDHDHATGQVRELLCRNCNQGLGHFQDNPALLSAAAAYLNAHGRAT